MRRWRERGWYGVRFAGWQLDLADHRIHRMLWSERNGIRRPNQRRLRAGPWCLTLSKIVRPGGGA